MGVLSPASAPATGIKTITLVFIHNKKLIAMSVTIKRKEQPRNTPLLTFILVAALPLFASFLGGISTGKVSDMNVKNSKALIEEAEKKALAAEAEIKLIAEIADSLNDIKKIITEEGETKFGDDLSKIEVGDQDAFDTWEEEKDEFFGTWKPRIGTYRNLAKDKLSKEKHTIVDQIFNLMDEVCRLAEARLREKSKNWNNNVKDTEVDEVDAKLKELEEKEKEGAAKDKLKEKDDEIKELKSELKDCQKGNNSAKVKENSDKITATVEEIRSSILPKIKSNILNSGKFEEIRISLDGKLKTISETARDMK